MSAISKVMFATANYELESREAFGKILNNYFPGDGCVIHQINSKGEKNCELGGVEGKPEQEKTYVFNNKAMVHLSHTIEDFALDQNNGELIATFETPDQFEHQLNRYETISQHLGYVRIYFDGKPRWNLPNTDFVPTLNDEMSRYWIVLYSGENKQVVLVCKQINESEDFNQRFFIGFFSLNPFIVENIRRSFSLTCCGLKSMIQQWEDQCSLPELCVQDLQNQLS